MANITLTPSIAAPGDVVDVAGAGFNRKFKFNLTTVNSAGQEVGQSTNINRPQRDGTFKVGIKAPTLEGNSLVRAYQQGVKVAEAPLVVKIVVTPPPPVDPKPTITSGPTVSLITQTGAKVSWALSEPCTGQTEYGTTTAYGKLSTLESGLLSSHNQNLSGLVADTTYHFRVHSKDSAGQEVISADTTFKTSATVITPPPPKTIVVAQGTKGYIAKAGDVIDGWTITGPGDSSYDGSTIGIYVNVPNVTIKNCTISGLSFVGIYTDTLTTNLTVDNNTISHVSYAGILTKGTTNSKITRNKIDHVGDHGHQTPDCNAYGIVITMDYGADPSTDILIDGNTVTDVPLWHGLNSHGGLRLTFSNNTVRRSARAIFITNAAEGGAEDAHDCIIINNDLGEPKSDVPAGGTDSNCAITLYKSFNTIVDNNKTGAYLVPINNVGNTSTFAHPPTGNTSGTVVTPPPTGNTVTVASIPDLMNALANNSYDTIIVKNGRYFPANAGAGYTNDDTFTAGLWIGSRFASRTNPVLVKAETKGGVILDGNGHTYFGGLTFANGSHHQTWDGFSFDNGQATDTGVIVFGSWPELPGSHHITLRNITLLPRLTSHTRNNDHGVYFSSSSNGAHDLVLEDFDVQGNATAPLSSAWHHDHDPNCYNLRGERWKVKGVYTGVFFYSHEKHDITLKDWTIDAGRETGIDLTYPAPNIRLENVIVTNTPVKLHAPNGTAGLTIVGGNLP